MSKVASSKTNIQTSIRFPYASNENSENEIKITGPFIIASRGIKYLDIHLKKEMQDKKSHIVWFHILIPYKCSEEANQ